MIARDRSELSLSKKLAIAVTAALLAVSLAVGPAASPAAATSVAEPTGLVGSASADRVTLRWDAHPSAAGYNVYRNDRYEATVWDNHFVELLNPGVYQFYVTAFDDGARNFSTRSNEISLTVADPPEHPQRPDAVVSLGDSFISGEGGRWKGNSTDLFGSRDSTDRAHDRRYGFSTYDDDRVYVGGTDGRYGCHRSDVAPIISARIPGAIPVNLACSGAVASEVHLRNQQNRRTQPIQTNALAQLTNTHDVELVVLSIGGNDIGFSDIIQSCLARFIGGQHICRASSQRQVDARMGSVERDVGAAIDAVRQTLVANGDRQHRIVLQSYPSVLPRGENFRMSESRFSRLRGGCYVYDKDATWARDVFVPEFDAVLGRLAAAHGAEFLSLRDAFDGKEVCADTVRQASENDRNQPDAHEWVRFVAEQQGVFEEALHPNMYGQQAIGRCLRLLWDSPGRDRHVCTNTGGGPAEMTLSSR